MLFYRPKFLFVVTRNGASKPVVISYEQAQEGFLRGYLSFVKNYPVTMEYMATRLGTPWEKAVPEVLDMLDHCNDYLESFDYDNATIDQRVWAIPPQYILAWKP
jgi:hypothetical protein